MKEKYSFDKGALFIWVNLNILSVFSYVVLIGKDCLEAHQVKLNYCNNKIKFFDEEGNPRTVKGIPKTFYTRNILVLQFNIFF